MNETVTVKPLINPVMHRGGGNCLVFRCLDFLVRWLYQYII